MKSNIEQIEREKKYQEVFAELNINEQSIIKMPIFTPGQVAIFEDISFGITIESSPMAQAIKDYGENNK